MSERTHGDEHRPHNTGRAGPPGIVIVNLSLNLVNLNAEAQRIMAECVRMEAGIRAKGVLPAPFRELCRRVSKIILVCKDENDLDSCTLSKNIKLGNDSLFLTCFAIPDLRDLRKSSIVLLMWTYARANDGTVELARKRFTLTAREVAVLEYLIMGMTNKEIAKELKIVEQTVKDHLKNIMQKTHSKTRTSIVSKILQLA